MELCESDVVIMKDAAILLWQKAYVFVMELSESYVVMKDVITVL